VLVAKENVVFCLLQEKKRSTGTFKIQPSISLQKVKVETGFLHVVNMIRIVLIKYLSSFYDKEHFFLQVKEFLPQIKRANVKVHEDIMNDPDKKTIYDIENIVGASGPVIEMVCIHKN
jgi:hypothetical protein